MAKIALLSNRRFNYKSPKFPVWKNKKRSRLYNTITKQHKSLSMFAIFYALGFGIFNAIHTTVFGIYENWWKSVMRTLIISMNKISSSDNLHVSLRCSLTLAHSPGHQEQKCDTSCWSNVCFSAFAARPECVPPFGRFSPARRAARARCDLVWISMMKSICCLCGSGRPSRVRRAKNQCSLLSECVFHKFGRTRRLSETAWASRTLASLSLATTAAKCPPTHPPSAQPSSPSTSQLSVSIHMRASACKLCIVEHAPKFLCPLLAPSPKN